MAVLGFGVGPAAAATAEAGEKRHVQEEMTETRAVLEAHSKGEDWDMPQSWRVAPCPRSHCLEQAHTSPSVLHFWGVAPYPQDSVLGQ